MEPKFLGRRDTGTVRGSADSQTWLHPLLGEVVVLVGYHHVFRFAAVEHQPVIQHPNRNLSTHS